MSFIYIYVYLYIFLTNIYWVIDDIFLKITGMGMTIPYWDFLGSTIVTKNYIRLTPDLQSQQGALWNSAVIIHGFFYGVF